VRVLDPQRSVWVDGERSTLEAAAIPLSDPALQSGLGLFETFLVHDGRVIEAKEHLSRMREAATRLSIPLASDAELLQTLERAQADPPLDSGWMKLLVSRGGRWIVFSAGLTQSFDFAAGQTAVILPWRRNPDDPLRGLKTLNYAANTLGLEEARRRGADEGLWLNTRGHLAEGCATNCFLLTGRTLFTAAPRDGILAGVVREVVLRVCRDMGLTIHEGKVRIERIRRAHEAFLTSSLRGVMPLIRIDKRTLGDGRPGKLTQEIAKNVKDARGLLDTVE